MPEKSGQLDQLSSESKEKLQLMLRAFYLALFSGPKTEGSLVELKEAVAHIREADLLTNGVATGIARNLLATAFAELFQTSQAVPLHSAPDLPDGKITALTERIERLLDGPGSEFLSEMLAPHRQLVERLTNDNAAEKKELAAYITRTLFSDKPLHCFIQASTTAIELGIAIAKNPRVANGTLFHTNSIVFPLTVLKERCPHWVYTFCGSVYDPLCGGWLIHSTDTEPTRQLRDLFERERDPLTTVFLTPICTSAEGGMYFIKDDTAHLVGTILSTRVQHVVIMTVASRVHTRATDGDAWCTVSWSDYLTRGKKVSLIVAGRPRQGDLAVLADLFAKKGVDVHYCQTPGGEWARRRLRPTDQQK
jgi:hypothetical protein